jgi:hypothetical protein
MGWIRVDPAGGQKPMVPDLGPFRVAPVDEGAALLRPWRTSAGSLWFFKWFALLWITISVPIVIGFVPIWRYGLNDHTHSSWPEALRHDPWIVATVVIAPLLTFVVTYLGLAASINRTRIEISSSTLSIQRGPLPWPGRFVAIAASTLRQVYVQEYESALHVNDRPVKEFRVMAGLTDGRQIVIDSGMDRYSDARALEQWIEERLITGRVR